MFESDYQYFLRRAAEEREAAERASHPGARQSHLELAQRYADVAEATNGSFLQLNIVSSA